MRSANNMRFCRLLETFGLVLLLGIPSQIQAHDDPEADDTVSYKSPFLAFALSALATGVPLAMSCDKSLSDNEAAVLGVSALVLGPGAGYMYGGAWGRAFTGMGIRFGAAWLTYLASGGADAGGKGRASGALLVIGGSIFFADVIADLISVGPDIGNMNAQKAAQHGGVTLNLSPTYRQKTKVVGVRVILCF